MLRLTSGKSRMDKVINVYTICMRCRSMLCTSERSAMNRVQSNIQNMLRRTNGKVMTDKVKICEEVAAKELASHMNGTKVPI